MYGENSAFKFGEKMLVIDSKKAFDALVTHLIEKEILKASEWKETLMNTDGVQIQSTPKTKRVRIVELDDEEVVDEDE